MTTVLLVRHGRTTANADGTLAGRLPVTLDEHGRGQAAALRERFAAAALPLAAVVTSPLARCRETLRLVLPGVPATDEARLVECGYGSWTGRRLTELAGERLWRAVQDHPAAVTFPGPGGEAMAAMSARAVAAVRHWDEVVAASHGPDAVWLACSHGDVIKAIVADALGLHLDQFQRIVIDPASVTVIRYTPARPFLVRLNDTGSSPYQVTRAVRAACGSGDAVVGGGAGPDGAAGC